MFSERPYIPTELRDKDNLYLLMSKYNSVNSIALAEAVSNGGEVSNLTTNEQEQLTNLIGELFIREVDYLDGMERRLEELKEKIKKQKEKITKIESTILNLETLPGDLKISERNTKELEIEDESLIPVEFFETKKVLNKSKLTKAIDQGLKVQGVTLQKVTTRKVKVNI